MSQYQYGTVDVLNGQVSVVGHGTAWSSELAAGDLFSIAGEGVWYEIGSVQNDANLTLKTPYAGSDGTTLSYTVQRDFTPNFQFPTPSYGDTNIASLLRSTFLKLDAYLASFSPLVATLQGNMGLQGDMDVDVTGAFTINGVSLDALIPPSPGGRLTLVSGEPVMTSGVAAATALHYTPDQSDILPIWNGTIFVPHKFTELSFGVADTTKQPAAVAPNSVYDVFAWDDAGTLRLVHGPAWTDAHTRSLALASTNGVPVNAADITNGPLAHKGTWLGTILSDANGQLNFIYGSSANGGGAAILGVWNAYNRVEIATQVMDTTASWSYATAGWRAVNGSNANRVTFVVGATEDPLDISAQGYQTAAVYTASGVGLNSTSTPSGRQGPGASEARFKGFAQLGSNYAQALEFGGAAASFNGNELQALTFALRV